MVVAYGTDALRIRMRFVDLRRVGTQQYGNEIRTPDYHLQAVLTSKPGHRRGERYFRGDDGSRRCPGFTRTIDYRRNVCDCRATSCTTPHPARTHYVDQPFSHRSAVVGQTPRLYRPQG